MCFAKAGFVLPVTDEGASAVMELFLGEGFAGRAGRIGWGIAGNEVLFVNPEAALTPGGVGHLFDAEGFHVVLGLEVLDKGGEDLVEGVFVFGGEAGGAGGEVMGEGFEDGLRELGPFGACAVAAGGVDLSGGGVTRHRCSRDLKLAWRVGGTDGVGWAGYLGINGLGAISCVGKDVNGVGGSEVIRRIFVRWEARMKGRAGMRFASLCAGTQLRLMRSLRDGDLRDAGRRRRVDGSGEVQSGSERCQSATTHLGPGIGLTTLAGCLNQGFERRVRGSHHLFRKDGVEERINLQRVAGMRRCIK